MYSPLSIILTSQLSLSWFLQHPDKGRSDLDRNSPHCKGSCHQIHHDLQNDAPTWRHCVVTAHAGRTCQREINCTCLWMSLFKSIWKERCLSYSSIVVVSQKPQFLQMYHFQVVHSYAATAIEKILIIKMPNYVSISAAELAPEFEKLLTNLFNSFKYEGSGENEVGTILWIWTPPPSYTNSVVSAV